jgi:hypothetical protein
LSYRRLTFLTRSQERVALSLQVRQVGIQRNGQEQVEALVRLLLEPMGRRQRQKVIALLVT